MRRPLIAGFAALLIVVAAGGTALWVMGARDPRSVERLQCLAPRQLTGKHAGMAWIPGGNFGFGDTVYPEEGPVSPAHVNGFWMDVHEVTNAEFESFVRATGYVTDAERGIGPGHHPEIHGTMREPGAVVFVMPNAVDGSGNIAQWWQYIPGANWRHPGGAQTSIEGREAFPVVEVTYADALAYARWRGHELPTEAEWEWAARGGRSSMPDHEQPSAANTWQGIFPVLNSADDGFAGLAPVGCYKANAYGLHDMIGNVWEWTSDFYSVRHDTPPADGEARRVIKGGSYLCAPNYCMRYRAGSRQPQESDLAASHLGFRTILRNAAQSPPDP